MVETAAFLLGRAMQPRAASSFGMKSHAPPALVVGAELFGAVP